LFRFFHLTRWYKANSMSIIIFFFTVLCRILSKIIYIRNDQVFISFRIIIVALRYRVSHETLASVSLSAGIRI
jgi:hypothetical protein